MKLTHTADHGLAGLFVGLYAEGRILLGEFLKADAQLIEVFLSLRLYGDTDHGIGEFHSLKHDGMILVAECVSGADILETYSGAYIAAADNLFRVLLVGMHLEKTGDTLFLAGT